MSDRYRWNAEQKVWEFHEPAWGGWNTLRRGPHVSNPPMTFAEGIEYIVIYPLSRGREPEMQWVRDRMRDIRIEHHPTDAAASSMGGGR